MKVNFHNSPFQKLLFIAIIHFQLFIVINGQDKSFFRSVVDTLSSKNYYGRGYVENGVHEAAAFLEHEFSADSLRYFKNNYLQDFYVDVNTFPGQMELKINGKLLIPGADFLVDPASPSVQGSFKAITIQKKDVLNEKALRKKLSKSSDKILVIDERKNKTTNDSLGRKEKDIINFLKYGKQAPNFATIILTDKKLTWYPASVQAIKPVLIINPTRKIKKIKNVDVNIKARKLDNYKTDNIIGYVPGTEVADSFLVVTAHYDHLGMMGTKTCFPGANDNASGISMLLGLAKYYSKHPPKYSMVFIALSAEELGLLGAKYFTDNPLFDLNRIKFLINFDLAGTGSEGIKVVNATKFPKEFKRLQLLNDSSGYLVSVQPRGDACNSDHCMFYQKGVPCFYIYTLGGIKAYHDIYDKPETLPLTEIEDYFHLMADFFNSF